MADKTPVRVVFNESNVATGLAEFQSGETVPVANGGTGLSSIGSAGQVLRTNAAGNALEFATLEDLGDILSIGSTLTAPSNADFNITTAGTGNIVLNDVSISDNSISTNRSNDDLILGASGTGNVFIDSNAKFNDNVKLLLGDSDDLQIWHNASNSIIQNATGELQLRGNTIRLLNAATDEDFALFNDDGSVDLYYDNTKRFETTSTGVKVTGALQLGSTTAVSSVLDEDDMSTNSDTSLATQQSIKAYVDAQITAEDLDFQADSGGALAIDLDSETMTFTGGTGIDTSGSGNTVTFAIDSTVATLTGSQTLTNKVITSPTISGPTITGTATIGAVTTNSISSNGSNADLSIQPSGTGDVLISALRINGTTLDSSDSSKITIAEALDVTGAFTASSLAYPTSDGSAGQFMTTDGAGTLSFADLSLGDLTIVGSTITTPSNADFVLDPSGSGKVNINGAYTLPSSDGTSGQVLQTNGSGTLSFADVSLGDFTFTGSTISSPSNADITLDPSGSGDIQLKANTVITGNLTVSGTQTTLETTTLVVEDPLLELAKNNSGGIANTFDQGLFFNRGSLANVSFLWDESADEFVAAVTSGEDGTTSGNVTIDSYANFRAGIVSTTGNVVLGEDATIIFEGASDNESETVLTVVDPTADRTISLPNKSGTLAMDTDLNFPVSTLAAHPAASGDADLGSNVTAAILDAFGVPTGDLYDMAEPRGSTSTVDLGAFS